MGRKISFIGLQNGDEGKGKVTQKIVSLAAERVSPDLKYHKVAVERYEGGPNAGHTLIHDGETLKLHQIPCGITIPQVYNHLGEGMYINPRKLVEEMKDLQGRGIPVHQWNLGIAATAQVILDNHVKEDLPAFKRLDHTSTGNGIKQVAVDKYGRVGMRFIEFLDKYLMAECLEKRFPKGMPKKQGTAWNFAESYAQEREFLQPFMVQQHVAEKTQGKEYWICEGAQGFLLDVDAGQYPGVTSSHPAHVPNGTDIILGVVKLYSSSVGTGDRPFMSRMECFLEDILRKKWGEFGSTTGRKREIGWFDAVAVKYAVEATHTDYLIGTCGDRLEELHTMNEPLKMVTGYKIGPKVFHEWDVSFHRRDTLAQVEPIFEEFEPWEHFTQANGTTLTNPAQRYVDRIQELTGKEFVMLGTGPAQDDGVVYRNVLEL